MWCQGVITCQREIYKQIFCRFLSTTCFVLNIQFFQSLVLSHRLSRRNDYILINSSICSASAVCRHYISSKFTNVHKIPNLQAIWDWICLPWWPTTGSLTNGDKLSAHTTTFETKFAPGLYLSVGSIDDASECRVIVLHVFLVLLKRYDN